MTRQEVEAARERAEKAAPHKPPFSSRVITADDADFLDAARTDVPALAATVEQAVKLLRRSWTAIAEPEAAKLMEAVFDRNDLGSDVAAFLATYDGAAR